MQAGHSQPLTPWCARIRILDRHTAQLVHEGAPEAVRDLTLSASACEVPLLLLLLRRHGA